MAAWWEGLGLLEQIFIIIAGPSTLVLAVQTLMLIFGGGLGAPDSGLESDISGLSEPSGLDGGGLDGDGLGDGADIQQADVNGLSLFSIRGVMTFLTVFGWSGVVLVGIGVQPVAASLAAGLLGAAALVGMAYMLRGLLRLAESGNVDYSRALGKTASVYLTIPPSGQGQGKINLVLGDSLGEFRAVTAGSRPIATGAAVRVVDLAGGVYTVEEILI